MCNLLHNPSFEVGLDGWEHENVSLDSLNAFEGTQAAIMGSGISSLYQDVTLPGTGSGPLLLSFNAFSQYAILAQPLRGSFVVEVIWMDSLGNPVGTGLRLLVQGSTLVDNNDSRLTYFEITDRPPVSASIARLQFSKGVLTSSDQTIGSNPILIDQVILAPIENINLITNSGFQKRLFEWNTTNATATGALPYEGTNIAVLNNGEPGAGLIYQDVPIGSLPANSSFLLSFAARSGDDLSVRVEYRDNLGPVGTGLNLLIPAATLNQDGWKTFAVAVETPAPPGATIARVVFEGISVRVDKVILVPVKSPNLLLNPSFEDGLNNWTSENINIVIGNSYEGGQHTIPVGSAFMLQNVNIGPDTGCCYLLTFGAQAITLRSDVLVEVLWLDASGREIGLGTSLIIPESALTIEQPDGSPGPSWATFASVTEPSPPGAAAAQILFSFGSPMQVDLVSFTRIKCPPPPPPPTRGARFIDV